MAVAMVEPEVQEVAVVAHIPISEVSVGQNRRSLQDIAELAFSIRKLGLLNPITVTEDYHLIAGYHRLKACEWLGWADIPAIVLSLGELDAELAEIDENLIRNDLTILERAEALARRKQIYEARYPETKAGIAGGLAGGRGREQIANEIVSFAIDTATKAKVTPRTIQQDVQIASNIVEDVRDAIRETEVADSKKDLMELAHMEWEEQRKVAAHITEGKAASVADAKKQIKEQERREELYQLREAIAAGEMTLPQGQFEVIAVDPPWPYGTEYDSDGRRAANPYPEMSLEQIAALELPAADDCVLWLWTTHKFMRHSFGLLDRWGFREVAIVTWVKDKMGLGSWLRSQSEFCIMAVKGHPTIDLGDQTTVIKGPMREHSRKPDEFYELANSLCIGRKLDYFSREKREGWEQMGNEPQKFS